MTIKICHSTPSQRSFFFFFQHFCLMPQCCECPRDIVSNAARRGEKKGTKEGNMRREGALYDKAVIVHRKRQSNHILIWLPAFFRCSYWELIFWVSFQIWAFKMHALRCFNPKTSCHINQSRFVCFLSIV